MTYLCNCWYMAAWADEVPADGVLARRYLEEPVVLFRDGEGHARAVFDRCPHRFVPLSKGRIVDGAITCGYHGIAFDGEGRCVLNPHGPILKGMAVRHYPIVEAYRALWIWMGEPAAADPSSLRDLSYLSDAPETAFSKGYVCGNGNYELFVDNILDLTHADFLHPTTLGGGSFTRTRAKVVETDDRLTIRWDALDEVPTPLQQSMRGLGPDDRLDTRTNVEWSAPAIMSLATATAPVGTPFDGTYPMINVHIMTPETARTTHYFFASSRTFAVDDAALNERFAEMRNWIFATEDKPMIDAQHDRMGGRDFWELDPILLRIDEGAVRVRRKLARMIAAEGGRATEAREAVALHG
ncbi:aromatic ring-hydroxylating dioxygenase subunit alpha [Sphingomonas profundi]|uniref:aromatic ring-hydroxylating dioxygenase subunit alpha n=1 Tax=Alterirhizorhabdus profundi TaxID=2681549 RepID=UPI0018D13723|nr:aromatic ring-hydroxylating dioxygenase subunit alpha [Sphingomonas profundi]